MKDNIFSLVYSDYDTEEYFFFSGPSDVSYEEFKKLCGQLMPKAGYRAVLQKQSPKEAGNWICWRDVVESLVSLLEEQGYQRISLDAYRFRGKGSIIGLDRDLLLDERLGFSAPLISEYNLKLEKKIAEERKTRRKLSGLLKKKTVQIIK
jgi:hypothetical protein